MKKHYFSAVLGSMLMLNAFLPVSVYAEEIPETEIKESGLHTGYFESYAQYENASSAGRLIAANESSATDVSEALPTKFDLRTRGLVSSVKNQKSYSMCWSFSAISALETNLIARKPDIDLSEWHLAYYTYSQKFGFPLALNTDMDDVFQQGGNYYMTAPMLTGWIGPVSESVFPFDDMSVLEPDAELEEVKAQAEYHVSDAETFNYYIEEDNFQSQLEAIQQAVYQNKSISISYYNNSSYYRSQKFSYYNCDNVKSGGTYHAVSIVGWDDNFSAGNFKYAPPADGAWLVKNSWGLSWGDNGYFWISYYDPTIVEFYTLGIEPVEKHDAVYQYDNYGCWTALSMSDADETAYIANVFTAEEDTCLTSAMLCTTMPNEEYTVWTYRNLTEEDNPTSGEVCSETSGMLDAVGYHTIDLETAVPLQEGEKFSIVVKLSGEKGQHIPCEAYTESTVTQKGQIVSSEKGLLTKEMIERDFTMGESFYSSSGKWWTDVYLEKPIEKRYTASDGSVFWDYTEIGNICLRAMTKKQGAVIFSEDADALPVGTEISLSSPNSSEIYYSLNDNDYQLYTQPLIMPKEEIHISAYAVCDGVEYPAFEKNYTVQEAKISSLLAVRSKSDKNYLEFEKSETGIYTAEVQALKGTETFSLMPICTGEIISDGEWLVSGKMTQVQPDKSGKVTLYVSESGMKESIYEIQFIDDNYLLGDANNDKLVNAVDAASVLVYSAQVGAKENPELPDSKWLVRADYNKDGNVNALDAAGILVYAAEHGSGLVK